MLKINVATQNKLDCSKPNGGRVENPEVKSIDWNDRSDRKWLESHMHWAMNNNKEVRLIPMIAA